MDKDNQEIWVIGAIEENWSEDYAKEFIPLPIEDLSKELSSFQEKLSGLFSEMANREKLFMLDQITVNAEISTEGKVGFLGSGVKAGAKGGITFTFSRKKV